MPNLMTQGRELDTVFNSAVRRGLTMGMTFYDRNRWLTLRGRLLSVEDNGLVIETPKESARTPSRALQSGDELGLSFRMGQYRYSCSTSIIKEGRFRTEEGTLEAFLLVYPEKVQRMDRRVAPRAELSPGDKARVSFWPGGKSVEPDGICPDRPTWSGNIVDLSTGGFGVRTSYDAGELMETGDIAGARLQFGDSPATLRVNAQLRHVAQEGTMCILGFQFVDMDSSDEDKATLDAIESKVNELIQNV